MQGALRGGVGLGQQAVQRTRERFPDATVGSGCHLAQYEEAVGREIRCRPPVCLIHGQADQLVPVISAKVAKEVLERAGVKVESHILEGLGHGLDAAALVLAAAFLRRVLGD